jgi:hypothetical protein
MGCRVGIDWRSRYSSTVHMACLCVQCDEAAVQVGRERMGVSRLTTITMMMMTMTIMTRAVIMAAFVSLMLVF